MLRKLISLKKIELRLPRILLITYNNINKSVEFLNNCNPVSMIIKRIYNFDIGNLVKEVF
jgi:hypothetical protein